MYKGLKITTIVLIFLSISVQLILTFAALPDAIEYRNLTGGGRAQAEFFAMPLFFIGGSFSILCLGLLIINTGLDIIRKLRNEKAHPKNILIYLGLVTGIALPALSGSALIGLMYSGWK